jgi:hypothetical protein
MTLNQNSTSARLYKWLYGTQDLPNNLCPYFWKVVLAYLVIVPYILLALPYLIVLAIYKESSKDDSFGKRIGIGFVLYFSIWCAASALCFIAMFFVTPTRHSLYEFMSLMGSLIWLIGLVLGGNHLWDEYKERKRTSRIRYNEYGYRIYEEPKSNLIVEFVKAKYGKYCPKINWK